MKHFRVTPRKNDPHFYQLFYKDVQVGVVMHSAKDGYTVTEYPTLVLVSAATKKRILAEAERLCKVAAITSRLL
jgi:hypothetical protein